MPYGTFRVAQDEGPWVESAAPTASGATDVQLDISLPRDMPPEGLLVVLKIRPTDGAYEVVVRTQKIGARDNA